MTRRRTRPTISAVLIVKDEESVLARCLESVQWADEVVVYDTGSSDRTVEIARELATTVVEGYWDDDFGAARNRALEHATGEWLLSIDADEVFIGDPGAVRAELGCDGATAYSVVIENDVPLEAGPREDAVVYRVFRRDVHHWVGQLHEQPGVRPGVIVRPVVGALRSVRLRHSGYRHEVMTARDKVARNLAIAERDLAEAMVGGATDQLPVLRSNLARSLGMAGRADEALALAEETYADGGLTRVGRSNLAWAMSFIAQAHGRDRECDVWLERWVAATSSPAWTWAAKARILAARGDAVGALDAVSQIPEISVNDQSQRLTRAELAPTEVWALAALARWGEAADVALRAAQAGEVPGAPEVLALVFAERGGGLAALLAELTPAVWEACAIQAGHGTSDAALAFLAEMQRLRPGDRTVLICASSHGPRMSLDEAIGWSLPIRTAGLADLCPLRAMATAPDADPRRRALAAAVAIEAYGETGLLDALADALAQVPPEHEAELAVLLEAAAPGLVSPVA